MSAGEFHFLYYPHIPKAVDCYLRAAFPEKYNDSSYKIILKLGAAVAKGTVIATYGDTKITAPCDGTIAYLGGKPGQCEWPEIRAHDDSVSYQANPEIYTTNNINQGALVFPSSVQKKLAYSFAIQPYDFAESGYYPVRYAFDQGNVWHDGKRPTFLEDLLRPFRPRAYTIYTTIDLLVYNLKQSNCGTRLPDSLVNDEEYRSRLYRYWELINHAKAALVTITTDRLGRPT